jgi:hypothetical protein
MKVELYWIPGFAPGGLAIAPRPRGGDWVDDEIRSFRSAGVDILVSLLTPDEVADLELSHEESASRANGVQFLSFPIADRGVPNSKAAVAELTTQLASQIAAGKKIVIHCRQGIGRAALIAICLLIHFGLDPATAIQRVSEARGCPVPETAEQKSWIEQFSQGLVATGSRSGYGSRR